MKKLISILLILAFIIQTTNQIWIIAAFYVNRDYIAANLCINRFDKIPVCKGSCFLEKQLNTNQQQQQKVPELKLQQLTLFNTDNFTRLAIPVPSVFTKHFLLYNTHIIPQNYTSLIFRPPSCTANA